MIADGAMVFKGYGSRPTPVRASIASLVTRASRPCELLTRNGAFTWHGFATRGAAVPRGVVPVLRDNLKERSVLRFQEK
jgi:hypothetical protein